MNSIVNAYHDIFVNKHWPDWSSLSFTLILTLILAIFGYRLFDKYGGEMVDEL
jgi:ABC-type polysaccharide/polyol phosphate export permease